MILISIFNSIKVKGKKWNDEKLEKSGNGKIKVVLQALSLSLCSTAFSIFFGLLPPSLWTLLLSRSRSSIQFPALSLSNGLSLSLHFPLSENWSWSSSSSSRFAQLLILLDPFFDSWDLRFDSRRGLLSPAGSKRRWRCQGCEVSPSSSVTSAIVRTKSRKGLGSIRS